MEEGEGLKNLGFRNAETMELAGMTTCRWLGRLQQLLTRCAEDSCSCREFVVVAAVVDVDACGTAVDAVAVGNEVGNVVAVEAAAVVVSVIGIRGSDRCLSVVPF